MLIRYAPTLAARQPVDDALYNDLATHFSEQQIIDMCLLVGAQTVVCFFNKTSLADVDEDLIRANEKADRAAGGRPIAYAPLQH